MIRRRAIEAAGAAFRTVGMRRHCDSPEHWLASASAVMQQQNYCLLVTEGPFGPNARAVQPFRPADDLTIYLGTSPTSRKAEEIRATGRVMLCYLSGRDRSCVVVHCDAQILDTSDACARHFMPVWRAFWPGGPHSDNFAVVRCQPHRIELWDARRGVTPPPFGLAAACLVHADEGTWAAE